MLNKKWEVYANLSQNEAFQTFKQILEKQRIPFEVEKASPNFMYDSNNEQYIIKTENFVINVIYVSADPLTRIFASLLGTAKNFNGITFLSIRYHKRTSVKLVTVLKEFVSISTNVPWNITAYPRFRFAVLLQSITKLKWKRFLGNH
ncbi:hypothetical protein [Oceanobacillus damuensis]|uniref:hypothetical protein n=1 Tax=Oceanobacillus damuensis TaxID=937928 RepID=UPI0008373008|nr:hypothetical protein [Oceanobacillus damuensis]